LARARPLVVAPTTNIAAAVVRVEPAVFASPRCILLRCAWAQAKLNFAAVASHGKQLAVTHSQELKQVRPAKACLSLVFPSVRIELLLGTQ